MATLEELLLRPLSAGRRRRHVQRESRVDPGGHGRALSMRNAAPTGSDLADFLDPAADLQAGRLEMAQDRTAHARARSAGTLDQMPLEGTQIGSLARGGATGEVFRPGNTSLSPSFSDQESSNLAAAIARTQALRDRPLGTTGLFRDPKTKELTGVGRKGKTMAELAASPEVFGTAGTGISIRAAGTLKRSERKSKLDIRRDKVAAGRQEKGRARKRRIEARKLQAQGLTPMQALAMAGGGEEGGDIQKYMQLIGMGMSHDQAARTLTKRAEIEALAEIEKQRGEGLDRRAAGRETGANTRLQDTLQGNKDIAKERAAFDLEIEKQRGIKRKAELDAQKAERDNNFKVAQAARDRIAHAEERQAAAAEARAELDADVAREQIATSKAGRGVDTGDPAAPVTINPETGFADFSPEDDTVLTSFQGNSDKIIRYAKLKGWDPVKANLALQKYTADGDSATGIFTGSDLGIPGYLRSIDFNPVTALLGGGGREAALERILREQLGDQAAVPDPSLIEEELQRPRRSLHGRPVNTAPLR